MRGLGRGGCSGPCVYSAVPDGGWGWAVATAFFVVEVCTYGTIKSLGIFLQDLMEEFKESNSRVSWIISICVFILTFTAPLSTVLSNHFGYQPVVMVGGFLISLGTIASAFTNSINEMYITIGVISGLGYCLTFLPTVTILAQYFSSRRALVTSIASTGESFAMFAFAPAFTALKQEIGWRYCLVIIGILQASVIGCGALLRPIIIKPVAGGPQDDFKQESLSFKKLQSDYKLENEETRTSISSEGTRGSEDSGITSLSTYSEDLCTATVEAKSLVKWEEGKEPQGPSQSTISAPLKQMEAAPLSPPKPKLLDFSVLKDPTFIFYSLFGLFATLGFFAPQLYIIELSKSRGVEPSMASYMLSAIAVADVCGRLSIGVFLNKVRCRKIRVLLVCVFVLCLVLVAFTMVWEFWGLAVCCALYGFFMGTVASTHIPMLAEEDVVGIQRMSSSVGVYVFIQSFAGLAGPPLGGALVDVTQNYGAAFYSCAAGMGLGAVCLAMVGPVKSGMCLKGRRSGGEDYNAGGRGVTIDREQPDFLEMDLDPESSPTEQASHGKNGIGM